MHRMDAKRCVRHSGRRGPAPPPARQEAAPQEDQRAERQNDGNHDDPARHARAPLVAVVRPVDHQRGVCPRRRRAVRHRGASAVRALRPSRSASASAPAPPAPARPRRRCRCCGRSVRSLLGPRHRRDRQRRALERHQRLGRDPHRRLGARRRVGDAAVAALQAAQVGERARYERRAAGPDGQQALHGVGAWTGRWSCGPRTGRSRRRRSGWRAARRPRRRAAGAAARPTTASAWSAAPVMSLSLRDDGRDAEAAVAVLAPRRSQRDGRLPADSPAARSARIAEGGVAHVAGDRAVAAAPSQDLARPGRCPRSRAATSPAARSTRTVRSISPMSSSDAARRADVAGERAAAAAVHVARVAARRRRARARPSRCRARLERCRGAAPKPPSAFWARSS